MDEPAELKFCREVKNQKIVIKQCCNQKIFDTCPGFLQNLDQEPDGALKTVFLKYSYNFGIDEPTDLKICEEVKYQKIFDPCSGFPQNLDQGPDEALKTVFLICGWNFGMDEPTDLKFCRGIKHQKVRHGSRVFTKFGPGA